MPIGNPLSLQTPVKGRNVNHAWSLLGWITNGERRKLENRTSPKIPGTTARVWWETSVSVYTRLSHAKVTIEDTYIPQIY